MYLLYLMLLVLLVVVPPAGQADETLQLIRVVVVDNSGSMSGERSATVRQELQELSRQAPPSPSLPIVLVRFGTQAAPALALTDPTALAGEIAKLDGSGGGTSIASGLTEATRYLKQANAQCDLLLMLYTDGQDADVRAISRAEQRLSEMLTARGQQGLRGSVVRKRWGSADAKLTQKLQAHPHVDVIDGADLRLLPVTLDPQLRLVEVRRGDDPAQIEVSIAPEIAVRGASQDAPLPKLALHCTTPGVGGDTTQTLDARQLPDRIHLTVPLDPEQIDDAEVRLDFNLTPIAEPRLPDSALVLPQLLASNVQVAVPLPKLEIRNHVKATIDFHKPPRWSDPLGLRAVYPLKITFEVTAAENAQNVDRSASLAIEPQGSTTIVAGQQRFTLPGVGRYDIELELEVSPADSAVAAADMRFEVDFIIRPIQLPPNLRFEPPELHILRDDLPAPDHVSTEVRAQVESLAPARWLQLPNLAVVDGTLRVDVIGPVPPGSQLRLSPPDEVKRIDIADHSLTSGAQRVPVRFYLNLASAPHSTRFASVLSPSTQPHPAIELSPGAPLLLTVLGPPPMQVVNTDRGRVADRIHRSLSDTATQVEVDVCPQLAGPATGKVATGIKVDIRNHNTVVQAQVPIGQQHRCRFEVEPPAQRSFYRDHQQAILIHLTPSPEADMVRPGQMEVVITHLAPLKRLLFYIGIVLSVVIIGWCLLRTFTRLTAHQE